MKVGKWLALLLKAVQSVLLQIIGFLKASVSCDEMGCN